MRRGKLRAASWRLLLAEWKRTSSLTHARARIVKCPSSYPPAHIAPINRQRFGNNIIARAGLPAEAKRHCDTGLTPVASAITAVLPSAAPPGPPAPREDQRAGGGGVTLIVCPRADCPRRAVCLVVLAKRVRALHFPTPSQRLSRRQISPNPRWSVSLAIAPDIALADTLPAPSWPSHSKHLRPFIREWDLTAIVSVLAATVPASAPNPTRAVRAMREGKLRSDHRMGAKDGQRVVPFSSSPAHARPPQRPIDRASARAASARSCDISLPVRVPAPPLFPFPRRGAERTKHRQEMTRVA